jgi:DNA-binding response OmpR family regulator
LLPPGRRIVLVDDNRDAADTLAMALRLQGHEVEVAYDGESGFEIAQQHPPGIMLLDLGLPGVDGHEIARRIRQTEWGRCILLAALTGWGQEPDRARSMDAGLDAHFVKPLEPEQLSAQLLLVERSRARHGN